MWNDLTMKQRADVISMAVKSGMRDLNSIRSFYDKSVGSRKFKDGGNIEEERPPMVPFSQKEEVIITPDKEYNNYLNTLPDNQRFTPNEEYDSYLYWQLHGKPKDFKEAYDRGMFNYDHSDNSYHGSSIAYDDNGVGYFIKPKTHDTIKYELDWYNKSLVTEEGGHQRPMNKEEQAFHDDFKSKYDLIDDPNRPNYYRYQPRKKAFGGPTVNQGPYYVKNYPVVNAEDEGLSEFFMNHKNVAGMAIGKGLNGIKGKRRIVMNPYSDVLKTDTQKEGLRIIEAARHAMHKNKYKAPFELSEHQKNLQKTIFKGTPYGSNDEAFKQSIISRILVNDTANIQPTPEQMAEAARFNFEKYKKKALGGPLYEHVYMSGGPMGYYYDGLGDVANWLKSKLRPAKRYIENKAEKLGNLEEAGIEAGIARIENFIAKNLLQDEERKKVYLKKKEAAFQRADEALKIFQGEEIPKKPIKVQDINPEKKGIKPNAYSQFNTNAQKKSREDYIEELKNMDTDQLMEVQQQLADEGKYDRKLSGGKNYIKSVQKNLIKEGYLPQGEDDGIVGPKTQAAYNQWLRNINVDGKLGNKTIKAYLDKGNNEVSTKGIDGCAQWTTLKYESMADGRSLQNGVIGNAWEMIKNIENKGGSILYNIYDDDAFKKVHNVADLKSTTTRALKEHPLDYSQLQIGDVVGIYMPSSNMHEVALKDGTTKNTHVGIITGFNENGIPIVEHNIHQSHRRDLITNISGSKTGKAQVATVARPAQVNVKADVKETKWNEAKSKFEINKKYRNASINTFANSMAGIAPQIQKIYPDVDMDSIQEIALAVQKRETNFMTNNISKQGLISQIEEAIGNKYREMKGQTEFSKSSDLAKMKMSALTQNERQFLGIKSKKDMEDPKKAGAAAALYLARNMNYLQNVRKMNPNLNLTDEDIYNLTILSYNQDISDLGFSKGEISQEEINNIRKYYNPKAKIKDINSTKYKHLRILGDLFYENFVDGSTPYIGAAKDAAAKYITKK